MKVKRNGTIYNFVKAVNYDSSTYDFLSGRLDVCQARLLFIKSLILITICYVTMAVSIVVGILGLVGMIYIINAVFGADVTYYSYFSEELQDFMLVVGFGYIVIGFGVVIIKLLNRVKRYLYTRLILKPKPKPKPKKIKTTPIRDMYRSWKGKYCTKMEIVE